MAKASSPKKTQDAGVMDVASTNKTANTGSRPIIVTNRPMVEDPMVNKGKRGSKKVPDEDKPSGSAPEVPVNVAKEDNPNKRELILTPDSDKSEEAPKTGEVIKPDTEEKVEIPEDSSKEEAIEEAEEAVDAAIDGAKPEEKSDGAEKVEVEKSEDAEEAPKPEPKTEDDKEEKQAEGYSEPGDDENGGGLVDELAKQAASKKQQQQEDKAASVEKDRLQELVAAKTYYVPTTQIAKRRVKNVFITLVLILILSAITLNFIVDAELIDIGVSPLTNLL